MRFTAKTWRLTAELAIERKSCYEPERVRQLLGTEGLTIAEILELEIPLRDRIWACCQAPWEIIEPAIVAMVTRAVEAHALYCGALNVEGWAAKWLSGENRSEEFAMAAVRAAAGGASWAAARAAADCGSGAGECAAGWAAAAWASDYTDRAQDRAASAIAASWAASRDAERERQIEDFRKIAS